ncbi:hypothetical protein CTAYLR_008902 [Chrysophaeum taylorii]|uniref:Uncharacterized protein n=1 Tax=Chrysophaeum taylorii TaxID=2483200 RepID=A0AAD7UKP5_9STRA|nr:hypothetical protein CTAYLR_008902 [Chrysophaeum taylorii]
MTRVYDWALRRGFSAYATDVAEAADSMSDLFSATSDDLDALTQDWKNLTRKRFLRELKEISASSFEMADAVTQTPGVTAHVEQVRAPSAPDAATRVAAPTANAKAQAQVRAELTRKRFLRELKEISASSFEMADAVRAPSAPDAATRVAAPTANAKAQAQVRAELTRKRFLRELKEISASSFEMADAVTQTPGVTAHVEQVRAPSAPDAATRVAAPTANAKAQAQVRAELAHAETPFERVAVVAAETRFAATETAHAETQMMGVEVAVAGTQAAALMIDAESQFEEEQPTAVEEVAVDATQASVPTAHAATQAAVSVVEVAVAGTRAAALMLDAESQFEEEQPTAVEEVAVDATQASVPTAHAATQAAVSVVEVAVAGTRAAALMLDAESQFEEEQPAAVEEVAVDATQASVPTAHAETQMMGVEVAVAGTQAAALMIDAEAQFEEEQPAAVEEVAADTTQAGTDTAQAETRAGMVVETTDAEIQVDGAPTTSAEALPSAHPETQVEPIVVEPSATSEQVGADAVHPETQIGMVAALGKQQGAIPTAEARAETVFERLAKVVGTRASSPITTREKQPIAAGAATSVEPGMAETAATAGEIKSGTIRADARNVVGADETRDAERPRAARAETLLEVAPKLGGTQADAVTAVTAPSSAAAAALDDARAAGDAPLDRVESASESRGSHERIRGNKRADFLARMERDGWEFRKVPRAHNRKIADLYYVKGDVALKSLASVAKQHYPEMSEELLVSRTQKKREFSYSDAFAQIIAEGDGRKRSKPRRFNPGTATNTKSWTDDEVAAVTPGEKKEPKRQRSEPPKASRERAAEMAKKQRVKKEPGVVVVAAAKEDPDLVRLKKLYLHKKFTDAEWGSDYLVCEVVFSQQFEAWCAAARRYDRERNAPPDDGRYRYYSLGNDADLMEMDRMIQLYADALR